MWNWLPAQDVSGKRVGKKSRVHFRAKKILVVAMAIFLPWNWDWKSQELILNHQKTQECIWFFSVRHPQLLQHLCYQSLHLISRPCSLHPGNETTDLERLYLTVPAEPPITPTDLWQAGGFSPFFLQCFCLFLIRTLRHWREAADFNSCFKTAEFKEENTVSVSAICNSP